MMYPIFWSVFVLLAGGFLAPVGARINRGIPPFIAGLATLASGVLCFYSLPEIYENGILTHNMAGWVPPVGIPLVADGLSGIVACLVALVGFSVVLLSSRTRTDAEPDEWYYSLVLVMLAGLTGVVLSGDLFNVFVFLEVSSVSAYALVARQKGYGVAGRALVFVLLGALSTSLVLLGVALEYASYGTLNIADLALRIGSIGLTGVAVFGGAFLVAGFLFKSALVPFHAWKPEAVGAGAIPVGLLLLGGSTTTGVYLMARTLYTLGAAPLFSLVFYLGVASMVVGGIAALHASDLKRILAFSSISQTGFVMFGVGGSGLAGELAGSAGVFHLIGMVLVDIVLFAIVALLYEAFGTTSLSRIRGAGRANTLLMAGFMVGVLGLAGAPATSGFGSKLFMFLPVVRVHPLSTVVAMVVSVVTLAYGIRMAYSLFFTRPAKSVRLVAPPSMELLLILCMFAILVLGVYPEMGLSIGEWAVKSALSRPVYIAGVLG